MVDPEGYLEAVLGETALARHAGVVEKHVDGLAHGADTGRAGPRRREVAEVERLEPRVTLGRAIASSTGRVLSSLRHASTRVAPRAARASAVARPMPVFAPVMTTRRPERSRSMSARMMARDRWGERTKVQVKSMAGKVSDGR